MPAQHARPPGAAAPVPASPPPEPAVYDPWRSDIPVGPAEIRDTVWLNPPDTPTPSVGDVVWYRRHEFGDCTEATVLDVQDPHDSRDDPNLWQPDDAGRWALRLPPWLELTLNTAYGRVTCRQARARGSAGWLPYDWDGAPTSEQHLARYRHGGG